MSRISSIAIRTVLVVLGILSVVVSINVAFGGLATLGWQGPTDFFQITDAHAYLIRDSHARFYGGVYVAIGLFMILAATNLRTYRPALNLVFALIFAGGLARLTQLEPGVLFGTDLIVSLLIELIGMPALYLWLRAVTSEPASVAKAQPSPAVTV